MLIDFTIENFKSIKEAQTFSLLATGTREHKGNVFRTKEGMRLLKTAVIYGANGSGKTNLVEAIRTMTHFIHNSTDAKLGEGIRYHMPFKLDRRCLNEPTKCEIEFIGTDDIRYLYKISFNAIEVFEEALFFYPKKQEAKLFSREKGKEIEFGDSLKGAKKSIENQLLPNHLFLSKAANSNHKHLGLVYQSLHKIMIVDTSQSHWLLKQTVEASLSLKDEQLQKKMDTLLNYADTGVHRVELRNVQSDPFSPSPNYAPFTTHTLFEDGERIGETAFNLLEESKGTQQMYALGGVLFTALSEGRSVCVDELDVSFHSLMTEYIVRLFHNPEVNKHNAQLIFSTHDTAVLKSDLFRRDQVWFAEKDYFGASNIYSLSEFEFDKVRANIPFDKWYLSGRFGALPLVKGFQAPEE